MAEKKVISEDELRFIVKNSLLSEITSFGSGLYFKPVTFGKCEIVIPRELRQITAYAMAGGKEGRGIDALPEFKRIFPFVSDINDAVVKELDTILLYVTTAANIAGIGTLQCTLLSIALRNFANLLSALGFIGPATSARNQSMKADSVSISFDNEIREKATRNAGGQLDGFSSAYPFYVFPKSAQDSASQLDQKTLSRDIQNYKSMMEDVRSVKQTRISDTITAVTNAMGVKLNSKEWEALKSAKLDSHESESLAIKAQAIKDMKFAAAKAVEHYENGVTPGSPLDATLKQFLSDVYRFSV
jgi:hypothetical protein